MGSKFLTGQAVVRLLSNSRFAYLASSCLQVIWVIAIWYTNATDRTDKLIILFVYSVFAPITIYFVPRRWLSLFGQLTLRNRSDEGLLALVFFSLVVGTTYAIWQEPQALVLENSVFRASLIVSRQGLGPFFEQYASIHWLGIQHPPLVPILNGFAMRLASESLFVIRLVSVFFGVGTVLVLYYLGCELYGRVVGLVGSITFVSFPYFLRLSASASNDIQVCFFSLLTLLGVFRICRAPSFGLSVLAGITLSMGILSNSPAFLMYPILFLVLMEQKSKLVRVHIATLMTISLLIVGVWLLYALHLGVFALQSSTILEFAGSQVHAIWGKHMLLEFCFTRLPSAVGVFTLPVMVLGGILVCRDLDHSANRFMLTWVAVFFGVISLTLPDARYCLPAFPALATLAAIGLLRIRTGKDKLMLMILANCAGSLYLFYDWHRTHHVFIEEVKGLMY